MGNYKNNMKFSQLAIAGLAFVKAQVDYIDYDYDHDYEDSVSTKVENDDEYYEKVSITDLTPSFKRKLTHSSDNDYNNNGYNYGSTGTYNEYDYYSTNDCACEYGSYGYGGYTYYDYYYNTYSYSYHASPDNGEPKE